MIILLKINAGLPKITSDQKAIQVEFETSFRNYIIATSFTWILIGIILFLGQFLNKYEFKYWYVRLMDFGNFMKMVNAMIVLWFRFKNPLLNLEIRKLFPYIFHHDSAHYQRAITQLNSLKEIVNKSRYDMVNSMISCLKKHLS